MKKLFSEILALLKKPFYTIPLVATLIFGFAYGVCTYTIGIDDLARNRYITGMLFAQGRFSSTLISYALGQTEIHPYFEPTLAVIFLFCAAVLLTICFKHATENKFSQGIYTVFACIFASYPLINEIFIYKGAELNIGIGYFLTAVSFLVAEKLYNSQKSENKLPKWKTILSFCGLTLIWIFLMSLYESFIFTYVVLVCALCLIKYIFTEKTDEKRTFGNRFYELFHYAWPLVLGVVLEFIMGKVLQKLLNIAASNYSANSTLLPDEISFGTLVTTGYVLFRRIFLSGLFYLPLFFFALLLIISVAVTVIWCLRKKSVYPALYMLVIYLGLFAIGILKYGDLKFRTCQSFVIFVALGIALIANYFIQKIGKDKLCVKIITLSLCGILVFFQCFDLNNHFYENALRWSEEKATLTAVCDELESGEYDLSKQIYFIGHFTLSDEVMSNKYVRADDTGYVILKKVMGLFGADLQNTDLNKTYVLQKAQPEFTSVINWGMDAFEECNTELLNICEFLGYTDFVQGDYDTLLDLRENSGDIENYILAENISETEKYDIMENSEFIVVKFK